MSTRATAISQMYVISPTVPATLNVSYRVGDVSTITPLVYAIKSKTVDVQLRVDIVVPIFFSVDRPSFFINAGATESFSIKFLPEEANRIAQTGLQQTGNFQISITPVNLHGPVMVN